MATGYLADEALGFVTDYTTLSLYIKHRMWDMKDDENNYGEVLEGGIKKSSSVTGNSLTFSNM